MPGSATLYCLNHPTTETLLRCNKCERPFCTKCLVRMAVGFRCRECLNLIQSGFYTATVLDYGLTALVGVLVSIFGGAIAVLLGGFWLFEIFYAPAAGGVISEVIRIAIQKHRGRYIWLVACGTVIIGGAIGAGLAPLVGGFTTGRGAFVASPLILPLLALGAMFNIGYLLYLVLAIGTVYARLR